MKMSKAFLCDFLKQFVIARNEAILMRHIMLIVRLLRKARNDDKVFYAQKAVGYDHPTYN